MLSLGVISFTREPALPVLKREHKGGGLSEFIRSVGPIIQNDKNHTNYCMVRLFSNGIFVIAPFLAIRAIEIMQKSDSYIGFLISVQMLGSILSYLIAGYVGDKWGIKQVVKLNHLTALITVVWAAFAQHQIEFAIIFVLFGMTLGFNQIGIIPMGIRLAPQDKRISYMTIQGFASFPGLFLAWGLAIVGKMASGSMLWLSIAAFVMMAVSSFYLARTNDSSS
jgi:MFS family permease